MKNLKLIKAHSQILAVISGCNQEWQFKKMEKAAIDLYKALDPVRKGNYVKGVKLEMGRSGITPKMAEERMMEAIKLKDSPVKKEAAASTPV